ncbi:hypothetical protein GKZ90_0006570 [Flavobacterium sp. MC2016-06]|jgi:hypothetical protein|uniref:hypothetical protein n=1 Tax=Flavobacterium sp. MC2016-06 TaxID=2676308 RepID=UPI0012BADD1C|nr:hypothetical protein [Flavobacterium sp. MC2016-06]MBU3857802.1 hypothetical protein [Flavobacterium sp. MC2016-06]
MKKIGLLLALFMALISCSNNDSDDKTLSADYFGKWELFMDNKYVETSIKPELFYVFNTDNTFVKTSIQEGVTTTALGTFAVLANEQGRNFTLSYNKYSSIITNCDSSLTENLFLDKSGYLSPILIYCDSFEKYKKAK